MFDNPYFEGVTSHFIFLLIMVMLGWIVYWFNDRRRLLAFFNIGESKRIVFYLSRLRPPVGSGTLGVDDVVRSYRWSAIPLYEVDLVPVLQRLFNFVVPGVESPPGFLKWLLLSDVSTNVVASPVIEGEIERSTTFIAVGSPGYNVASKRIEEQFSALAKFNHNGDGLETTGSPPIPITDPRCSFVQRVYNQTTKQTAFYVAGISMLGTTGAVYFLARRWKDLHKKYPNQQPFCCMLRITSDDGFQYEVLFERG